MLLIELALINVFYSICFRFSQKLIVTLKCSQLHVVASFETSFLTEVRILHYLRKSFKIRLS